jgi:hypothetical protein
LQGTVRRFNGALWVDHFFPVLPQSGRQLRAVHGRALADGGTLYSIVGTGTAWRRVGSGYVADFIDAGYVLRGTYVEPSGDIWAVGDDGGASASPPNGRGVLWHFDESTATWSPRPTPSRRAFTGAGGFGDVGPFVVGQGGVIVRKQGADGG